MNKDEIILNSNNVINDGAYLHDNGKIKIGQKFLRGHVTIRDEFGNIILDKDNLVVLRGRSYVLEKLFNDPLDPDLSGYVTNLNRVPCLFKIGCGGADLGSNPADPYVPVYDDEDLAQPVPFVIEDGSKHQSADKANNPSIIETMNEKDKNTYYLPVNRDDGQTEYYGKIFEAKPQWVFNKNTNEVYKKIMLRVDNTEARGYSINELGLVIGEYNSDTNEYLDAELMTRITFSTIYLNQASRYFTVEYNIYA